MKILVINGPNLNLLGVREPEIYGSESYGRLKAVLKKESAKRGVRLRIFQSNSESRIIDRIQNARGRFDGIIINAAAYTHTSLAIADALKAAALPAVEVHLSDPSKREEYRRFSYVEAAALTTIAGKGFDGYIEAMDFLLKNIKED